VRKRLGESALVGVSITCSEGLDRVDARFVDYVGIGPVFATTSKPDAAPALGLDALALLAARSPVPAIAIGGISLENARGVLATRVAGLAVVSAIASASDPLAATRALRAMVGSERSRAAEAWP
jgi:thiamine-phosphate pyrophosphorylase